jgi:hypothetical protein
LVVTRPCAAVQSNVRAIRHGIACAASVRAGRPLPRDEVGDHKGRR